MGLNPCLSLPQLLEAMRSLSYKIEEDHQIDPSVDPELLEVRTCFISTPTDASFGGQIYLYLFPQHFILKVSKPTRNNKMNSHMPFT